MGTFKGLALGVVSAGLLLGALSGGGSQAVADPATPGVSPVLAPVPAVGDGLGAPLESALIKKAVASALAPLGSSVMVMVADVATGRTLYSSLGSTAAIPASPMKLVTALVVLKELGPDARLTTRAVLDHPDADIPTLILVGAGDAMLASGSDPIGALGSRALPASTAQLAARAARSLSLRGVTKVHIGYDDSLFSGPAMGPDWSSSFPATGIIAPVSALMVDQGRHSPNGQTRVSDPAATAAQTFASQLAKSGIVVSGAVTAKPLSKKAASRATLIATVDSPTIGDMVERMLGTSDNDIAESLARLAAIAGGEPGSFKGVAVHSESVLRAVDIPTKHAVILDGSGLSRSDRLTAKTLSALLVDVARASAADSGVAAAIFDPAGSDAPAEATVASVAALGPAVSPIPSGLPIAGVAGSLHARFNDPKEVAGRGVVRAKTGTLSGVASLAGYASRADGRLLAFVFLANRSALGTLPARDVLDRAAAALVDCKCQESARVP